jgi:hypothetical protein
MIAPCESFPQIFASAALPPVAAADFMLSPSKNYFAANSTRYRKFSQQAPIRALDGRWFFAALPRVRARLAEVRAARLATPHNHRSTANSRTTREAARRVKHSPPRGRAPIRAGFISASEDEP